MYLRKMVTIIVTDQDLPDPDCDLTADHQYWTEAYTDNQYG